jgi:hypothetical protein
VCKPGVVYSALTVIPVSPAARIVNFIGWAMLILGGLGLKATLAFVPRKGRTPRIWIVLGVAFAVISVGGFAVAGASYVMVHYWGWVGFCAVVIGVLAWLGWFLWRNRGSDSRQAAVGGSVDELPASQSVGEDGQIPNGDQ